MLVVLGLSACATPDTYDETRGWTVDKLYTEARSELDSGNYTRAEKLYETLEARFPYGRYAQQAQMDIAYTYFKDHESELALAACDRFIKLHPSHPNLDYIYYLKGLVYLNNDDSWFGKWGGQDMSERDPKASGEAFTAFNEVVSRFPNSKYAEDALKKMNQLVDALGGYQMHVARYYMKRGAYVAAVNRAQTVLREYGNTRYVEESLALMSEGYGRLGMTKLHDDAQRVLALNYPKSAYLSQPWKETEMPWWKFWQ
ncbi:Beta-barrel assembly machine subunit BamD [Paludibacterium purpuratum]|uniref:Outer membrane protein assembly factor BamD n=2 Tax=Paludibacterium purpuratum TaxID=1144873 RepID=A0A4R7B133_9NEIS|nr:Beta-barrel assembly machine subunit BamD [Paludibacterium purpuratum]